MPKIDKMVTLKGLKILLTGGHAATPAISVVEEINKRHEGLDLYWIGSKYSLPGQDSTTVEYKILPKIGVKFYPILMGKLQTKFTRYTIPLILNIPVSFFQALFLILKIKPNIIVSFGGFSSFPVTFWGFILRIPIILHEQTTSAGRASIASGFFATKIALSRFESKSYFPKNKLTVTGNPVMSQILEVKPKENIGHPPVILVMGGSRGSEFINEEVVKIADWLTKNYRVIHITGETKYSLLQPLENARYEVLSFVDPRDMAKYYQKADIIISRAGANSVSEIMYIKRPAILIPLPRTFASEQIKNAEFAEKFGTCKMLLESEVNSESLKREIVKIENNWEKIISGSIGNESPDSRASQKLVNIIEAYLE